MLVELTERDERLRQDLKAIIPEEWWREIPGAIGGWSSMVPHPPSQPNLQGIFLDVDLPFNHYEASFCAYPYLLEDDEAKRRSGLTERYKACLEELKAKVGAKSC